VEQGLCLILLCHLVILDPALGPVGQTGLGQMGIATMKFESSRSTFSGAQEDPLF